MVCAVYLVNPLAAHMSSQRKKHAGLGLNGTWSVMLAVQFVYIAPLAPACSWLMDSTSQASLHITLLYLYKQ